MILLIEDPLPLGKWTRGTDPHTYPAIVGIRFGYRDGKACLFEVR